MITKKLEQERYRYTRHVRSELHERINHVVQRSRDLPSLYPDVTIETPLWIRFYNGYTVGSTRW